MTNSIKERPAYWYAKMDDKQSWHDFIRASIDHFRKKKGYFPVFITMNIGDRDKALGLNAKGVIYHKYSISVKTAKTATKLNIQLHY